MGTAAQQGEIWGARAQAWAEANEPAWQEVFEAVMERSGVQHGRRLLDVGCGAGGALVVARGRGAIVAGLDAAEALVSIARSRLPEAVIEVGEMEELPFADGSFDVVTGINSFQFASDAVSALREARRVVRAGGTVAVMVWGSRDECDLLSKVMPAVIACLPPAPEAAPEPVPKPAPATPSPLPLWQAGVIEGLMDQANLLPRESLLFPGSLAFPDLDTATRAILSACARAIAHSGEARVHDAVQDALRPLVGKDGTVRLDNRFRLVLGMRC